MQFNESQFNGESFNGGNALTVVYSTNVAVFQMFSLSDNASMLLSDKVDSGPKRDIIGANIPRDDGMYVITSYFRERTITLTGFVKQSTASALDSYLDTIRAALSTLEGNLDITEADGTVKRYIATCSNYEKMFDQRKSYNITICPFTIEFLCKTPFGKARDYSSVFNTLTASPSTQTPYNTGTYKAQPVIIMVFNTASGVNSVSITNTVTGEQIAYSGTIAAGNVLIFDSEMKSVTFNGVAADYSGLFPSLAVGSNSVQFTINGTFSVDTTLKYRNTYL